MERTIEVMKRAFLRGDAAAGSTMAGSTVDKWPVHQASLWSVWSPEAGLTNELDTNEEFQPPPADAIPFPFDGCHPSSADDDSLRTAVEGAAGADDAGELVAQGSPEAEAVAIQGNDADAVRDSRTGAPNATTGANRCPDNSQAAVVLAGAASAADAGRAPGSIAQPARPPQREEER